MKVFLMQDYRFDDVLISMETNKWLLLVCLHRHVFRWTTFYNLNVLVKV